MTGLTKEQIILLVLIVLVLLVGSGMLFWQKLNNDPIIAGLIEPEGAGSELAVKAPAVQFKPSAGEATGEAAGEKEEAGEELRVVFHVAGEVEMPGVYELTGDVRVVDAIRAAGGESSQADLDRINLAAPVYDGEKIYVPAAGEGDDSQQVGTGITGSSGGRGKISINTATADELEQLPGIGPSKAASIIKYRRQIGRFKDLNELLDVSGIGQKTLEQIKDAVSL